MYRGDWVGSVWSSWFYSLDKNVCYFSYVQTAAKAWMPKMIDCLKVCTIIDTWFPFELVDIHNLYVTYCNTLIYSIENLNFGTLLSYCLFSQIIINRLIWLDFYYVLSPIAYIIQDCKTNIQKGVLLLLWLWQT